MDKKDLQEAARRAGIPADAIERLWQCVQAVLQEKRSRGLWSIFLYIGALAIGGSILWWYTQPLPLMTKLGITGLYFALFLGIGIGLYRKPAMMQAGSILTTLGLVMTPLMLRAGQELWGKWLIIGGCDSWVVALAVSLFIAGVVFTRIRSRWVAAWLYILVWMLMEEGSYLYTFPTGDIYKIYSQWSVIAGLVVLCFSRIWSDTWRSMAAFFGFLWLALGLLLWPKATEFGQAIYLLSNLGILLIGRFFHRGWSLLFGGLGVAVYIFHLMQRFASAPWFPYVLGGAGLAIILVTIVWLRRRSAP